MFTNMQVYLDSPVMGWVCKMHKKRVECCNRITERGLGEVQNHVEKHWKVVEKMSAKQVGAYFDKGFWDSFETMNTYVIYNPKFQDHILCAGNGKKLLIKRDGNYELKNDTLYIITPSNIYCSSELVSKPPIVFKKLLQTEPLDFNIYEDSDRILVQPRGSGFPSTPIRGRRAKGEIHVKDRFFKTTIKNYMLATYMNENSGRTLINTSENAMNENLGTGIHTRVYIDNGHEVRHLDFPDVATDMNTFDMAKMVYGMVSKETARILEARYPPPFNNMPGMKSYIFEGEGKEKTIVRVCPEYKSKVCNTYVCHKKYGEDTFSEWKPSKHILMTKSSLSEEDCSVKTFSERLMTIASHAGIDIRTHPIVTVNTTILDNKLATLISMSNGSSFYVTQEPVSLPDSAAVNDDNDEQRVLFPCIGGEFDTKKFDKEGLRMSRYCSEI